MEVLFNESKRFVYDFISSAKVKENGQVLNKMDLAVLVDGVLHAYPLYSGVGFRETKYQDLKDKLLEELERKRFSNVVIIK